MTVGKTLLEKGWEVVRLGDYALTEKGKKPKNISKLKTDEFSLPYVNIRAFEKNVIDEYTDGAKCVICAEGDFLMVWDGSRSGFVGKAITGALGSTLVKITFPGIFLDYAYYFLQSKYLEINTRAKGTGTPHVDPSLLWNYHFPIPPADEQHRIVEKIEELFSELDKGIEYLKTAQAQLKVYRQAVLKWAFEGKLTEQENTNKILLGDVIEQIKYGTSKKCSYERIGQAVLRIPNIAERGKIDLTDIKYGMFDNTEIENYSLVKDDILIIRSNGSVNLVGRCSIVTKAESGFLFAGYLIRIRPNKRMIIPRFLLYVLLSSFLREQIEKRAKSTSGVNNINSKEITTLKIPITSIEEQFRIVQEIESRLSVCDKLEESIEQSLQQSEALRQSILKRAFEGRLV